MEISAVLGFALAAFALIIIPGPDWAFVLAAGSRDRVVIPAVAGLMLGYAAVTAVVTAGVGPVVASSPWALAALSVGGAAYLLHIGVRTLRTADAAGEIAGLATESALRGRHRYLLQGAGVSALNPKALLLFLSVLPQFAHAGSAWPMPAQLATLGAVYIAITGVVYVPLGHMAGRVMGARPVIARTITRVAGAAMVLGAVALVAERAVQLWA